MTNKLSKIKDKLTLDIKNNSQVKDRDDIDRIYTQAWELRNFDLEQALELAETAYELTPESYPQGKVEGAALLSYLNYYSNKYELAQSQALEAIELCEHTGLSPGLSRAMIALGMSHTRLGDCAEGLNYLLKALEISQLHKSKWDEAQALKGLAFVYSYIEDYPQALVYHKQSLQLYQELDDKFEQVKSFLNMGHGLCLTGQYEDSLTFSLKAVRLAKKLGGKKDRQRLALANIGYAFMALDQMAEAQSYFKQASELTPPSRDSRIQGYILLGLGQLYTRQKSFDQAESCLQQAWQNAELTKTKSEVYKCHQALSELYEQRGDEALALTHYKQYHQIKETVFNNAADNKLKVLEVVHQTNTARKEADVLRNKNQELEHEIIERKRAEAALNQAQQEAETARAAAEHANQAKSVFLANMSHELRTPLNGVLGYAQILKRRQFRDEDDDNALSIIHQSGQHLLALIDDILDLAKIEARKMELHPSDIYLLNFLEEINKIISAQTLHKNVQFTLKTAENLPPIVQGDKTRLRQILLNLLGNAAKFTDQGQVILRVSGNHQADDRGGSKEKETSTINYKLRFEVEDTGVGMTPDEIEKIFTPFEQVGEQARRAAGTGLGLTITRQLVALMGGEVQVQSKKGQGSIFWFEITVPVVAQTEDLMFTSRQVIGYEGRPQRVLVVDDKALNRSVLRNLLEPLGFEIKEASNGRLGLTQAEQWQPDMVLTDIVMPVMDGIALARALRQHPQLGQTKIIAVSANTFEEDQMRSQEVGCDGFLPKPVTEKALLATLVEQLKLKWQYLDQMGRIEQPRDQGKMAEVLLPPPQHELEQLLEWAIAGRIPKIRKHTDKIEALGAEYRPFAHKLRVLANHFQDKEIIAMLTQFQ